MTRTSTDNRVIEVGPKPAADQVRTGGAACALGALVLFAGAITTQIIQASTSVSDQLWHYPWSSQTAVIAWVVFGAMEALVLTGVLAWQRSGVAGSGRAARVGLPVTVIGTALIVVGHFASVPVRNQTIHDIGAQVVGGIFGAGTVLSAVGLALAGWATLRAGAWQDDYGVVTVPGATRVLFGGFVPGEQGD